MRFQVIPTPLILLFLLAVTALFFQSCMPALAEEPSEKELSFIGTKDFPSEKVVINVSTEWNDVSIGNYLGGDEKVKELKTQLKEITYDVVAKNFKPEFLFQLHDTSNAPKGWALDLFTLYVRSVVKIRDGASFDPPINRSLAIISVNFVRAGSPSLPLYNSYDFPIVISMPDDASTFLQKYRDLISKSINRNMGFLICSRKRNHSSSFCQLRCPSGDGPATESPAYCLERYK